ncbi:MAG: hypothetical protein J0H41_15505 [Rhizobiales bacterium]|nr:hypothetical protein [Hyphomicrobiales bacterium]
MAAARLKPPPDRRRPAAAVKVPEIGAGNLEIPRFDSRFRLLAAAKQDFFTADEKTLTRLLTLKSAPAYKRATGRRPLLRFGRDGTLSEWSVSHPADSWEENSSAWRSHRKMLLFDI